MHDSITPTERLNPHLRFAGKDSRSRIALDAHSAIKSSWMAQGESGWNNSIQCEGDSSMRMLEVIQVALFTAAILFVLAGAYVWVEGWGV
jgi:hypothetical protein